MATNTKTGHKPIGHSLDASERKRMLRQLDRIQSDLRSALKSIGMNDGQIARETARAKRECEAEEQARFALAARMLGEPASGAYVKHEPHKLTLGHRITRNAAAHDRDALARRMGVAPAAPAEPESSAYKLTLSAARTPRSVH